MPYLDDYGGNRYGRRYRTKRTAENLRSFNCLSCGKLFYATHRQMGRRCGVHCPNCGGAGEETNVSFKRRTGLHKTDAARLVGVAGDINKHCSGQNRLVSHSGNKPFSCEGCDKSFRTEIALKLHQEDHPDHKGK